MNRPSLANRAIATALTTFALLVLAETPAIARHHAEATSVTSPLAAPQNGEPLAQVVSRLEQSYAAHPTDAQIGAQLADAYIQASHPEMAIALTKRFLTTGQRSAPLLYFTGVAYRTLGQTANSIAAFQQAEAIDPTSSSVLYALTVAYIQTGHIDDALRESKRDATFNLHDERAHLSYGTTLALANQLEAARNEFALAQTLAPGDSRPNIFLGRTLLDGHDAAKAFAAFDQVLQKDPKNLDALNGEAAAYAMNRNVPMAVNTLERVLPLLQDPQAKIAVLTQETRLLLANGQNQLAEQSIKRGVTVFPALEAAHISYGDFLAITGRIDEARQQWTLAAGPDSTGRDGLLRLGNLALRSNNYQEAIAFFNRITNIQPNDNIAWNALGQAYLDAHDSARSAQAYRKSFSIAQTPEALSGIGTCDFISHHYSEAVGIFDTLIGSASGYVANNPRVLFAMARTYEAVHQTAKSRTLYTRLLVLLPKNSPEVHVVQGLLANLALSTPSHNALPAHRQAHHR